MLIILKTKQSNIEYLKIASLLTVIKANTVKEPKIAKEKMREFIAIWIILPIIKG